MVTANRQHGRARAPQIAPLARNVGPQHWLRDASVLQLGPWLPDRALARAGPCSRHAPPQGSAPLSVQKATLFTTPPCHPPPAVGIHAGDRFQLRFPSLFDARHSLTFLCEASGRVALDRLREGSRCKHYLARFVVGGDMLKFAAMAGQARLFTLLKDQGGTLQATKPVAHRPLQATNMAP